MKISAVICEYNPFHNGHEYMLSEMKKGGAEYIVACMSGNFCQRGEAAVYDKYTRTKAALKGGADLVIELPVSFACAGAERFAYGGVSLIDSLGCVDELVFGSECGDTELLTLIAEALADEKLNDELKNALSHGVTFASARQSALEKIIGEKASLLSQPNNILAVEYIKALRKINSDIQPRTILRKYADHDGDKEFNGFAGAKYIREKIISGEDYKSLVPEYAFDIYNNAEFPPPLCGRMKKLEPVILYKLRTMDVSEIACLPDISEGLENRIISAVRDSAGIDELIDKIKTKRYTRARIQRILMYALLGVKKNELSSKPCYIHILGFNEKGREILKIAKKSASLPVIMKYSDIKKADEQAQSDYIFESRADDIYALTGEKPDICGRLMLTSAITES